MGSKICSILGLLSIPVVLPGWNRASQKQLSRFEKARKSQKLRGVKTRAMWQQQGTYARPWKTSELEKLHSRHTQRSCVTESRDSPAESDAKIISITENVLYALKRFLCGLVGKHDTDWKNCDTVLKVVSKTVEFQDPVICFRGLKSLIWWLESLSAAPISMDVNEIYSENQATNFSKPQIHIVWTVVFTDYQERSSMQDSWRGNYMALLQDLHNLKEHSSRLLRLSGETRLEIDTLGQIASIHTSWYSMRDEPEQLQGYARLLLVGLLSRRN